MMVNMDDLLAQEEPEERKTVKVPMFKSLKVTKYALAKAYAYARLACDVAKGSIECGGYLTVSKDSDDLVATDAFLARRQDVSDGLFTVYAEDVIKAGREINESGRKVIGWWHSHGFLDTFFSQLDDSGQRTILNEISAFNYIKQKRDIELGDLETVVEGNKIIIFDKKNPGRSYEFELNKSAKHIQVGKMKILFDDRIGFAYGLVVNDRAWAYRSKGIPYAEIATREYCGACMNSNDRSVQVGVSIYDCEPFRIDDALLLAEIRSRVHMPKRRRFFFDSGNLDLQEEFTGRYAQRGYDRFQGNYFHGIQPMSLGGAKNPQTDKISLLFENENKEKKKVDGDGKK